MSIQSLFNKKCTIQKKTQSQTSSGQMILTWTDYATNIKCCFNTLDADERIIAGREQVEATHRLYMGYRAGLDEENYRIVVDGKTYDILSLSDASGREHHLEIFMRYFE